MSSRGRSASPVRQIKAIYEGFSTFVPLPRPSLRLSRSGSPVRADADGTASKDERSEDILKSPEYSSDDIDKSIDSVIEAQIPAQPKSPALPVVPTLPASPAASAQPTAPTLPTLPVSTPSCPSLRQRPSWVGPLAPSRPNTPGPPAMAHKVTITYQSSKLQPPVFITSSLSDPGWEIQEMKASKQPDGENVFSREFQVSEGQYQYKFRLGPGDWWVCDDSKPTVDDGDGNRNNVLVVTQTEQQTANEGFQPKHEESRLDQSQKQEQSQPKHDIEHSMQNEPHSEGVARSSREDSVIALHDKLTEAAGKAQPRTMSAVTSNAMLEKSPKPSVAPHTQVPDAAIPSTSAETHMPSEHKMSPRLAHEEHGVPDGAEKFDPEIDTIMNPEQDVDYDAEEGAPLLRHETFTFGDETMDELSPMSSSTADTSIEDCVCPEADPEDTSLERFPTHKAGIIDEIKRASRNLPEDETTEELCSLSPSQAVSNISLASLASLPSVEEESEDEVEATSKAPNRDLASITPPLTPVEYADQPYHPDHHHPRPAFEDMKEEREVIEQVLAHDNKHKHNHSHGAHKTAHPHRKTAAGRAVQGLTNNVVEPLLGVGVAAGVVLIAVWVWSTKT